MPDLALILLWTLLTLAIATLSVVLGRRYTVAYPIAMMAMLMTIANVLANKMVTVGPLVLAGGTLVYAATFLITDLVGELWGEREARTAVWAGFYGSVFLVCMVYMVSLWPSPDFAFERAAAWNEALALTPRIVLGSLVAYLLAQHLDVWLFHAIRRYTKGRHLWLRNNASTLVSQAVDSVVFTTIAFWGVAPLVPLILGAYVLKAAIALFDTLFMYGVLHVAHRVRPVPETQAVQ